MSVAEPRPGAAAPASEVNPLDPAAPAWCRLLDHLGTADFDTLTRQVRQRVREEGVGYQVHAEGDAGSRPWPLQLLPALVDADEWALIARGVLQRVRLMEATLDDLYGAQSLLREALLPAALVLGHPDFLRPLHGLRPVGGTRLHIAAFDIARSADGGHRLLALRLQAPSGLGYLLENRLIIGRLLAEPMAALQVQRVESEFTHLLDGLLRASPAGMDSRVALLTPGPYNETYFEQLFLARRLGIALVEGSDLTVRANRLYLKTLSGLEPVHVLLRRVDDDYLDPLELRADSLLGVPGLLQAMRAGSVLVANAPGAGVLESPGLAAFWPAVSRRLLGEDLRLPAAASWWCGEAAVWAAQRGRLAEFVVAPTFPGADFGPHLGASLDAAARAALAARIDAQPDDYTLQAPARPLTTPVWHAGRLQPRPAVLRVFALADGAGGWRVLPGAMTRVAGPPDPGDAISGAPFGDPWLSMQHGSASVDTWVLGAAPAAAVATELRAAPPQAAPLPILPQPARLPTLKCGVTSRAGESLFWLGRYTERADHCVRFVRVMLETLPDGQAHTRRMLGELAAMHGLLRFPDTGSVADAPVVGSPGPFIAALRRGLPHGIGTTSVGWNLHALKRCAQTLRERLSPEHWALIVEVNRGYDGDASPAAGTDHARDGDGDTLAALAHGATLLAAITGAQVDRMQRDDGWRLLSIGRLIERLHTLAQTLALGFSHRLPDSDDGFALLLELFDGVIGYRAQFQSRRDVLPLLQLLVTDDENPRALAWVLRSLRARLARLAAAEDPAWAARAAALLPDPAGWQLAALAAPAPGSDPPLYPGLASLLDGAQSAAQRLSAEITRQMFEHVATADHAVWQ